MNIKQLLEKIGKKNFNIIFEDPKIEIAIGSGLGIIPNQSHYLKLGLMPEIKLSNKEKNQIADEFRFLLKNAGINEDTICKLNNFNKDDLTFVCNIDDCPIGIMGINCENYLKNYITFTLMSDINTITYEYTRNDKYYPDKFEFQRKCIKNFFNDSCCYYSQKSSIFRATLICKDYNLHIEIDNLDKNSKQETGIIENEEILIDRLLNLKFPMDIKQVYELIKEASLKNIFEIPKIVIQLGKNNVNQKSAILEYIKIYYGIVERLSVTRGEKKITFSNNNWIYEDANVLVKKVNDNIDCKINEESKENICLSENELNVIKREVDDAIKLTRDLDHIKTPY